MFLLRLLQVRTKAVAVSEEKKGLGMLKMGWWVIWKEKEGRALVQGKSTLSCKL